MSQAEDGLDEVDVELDEEDGLSCPALQPINHGRGRTKRISTQSRPCQRSPPLKLFGFPNKDHEQSQHRGRVRGRGCFMHRQPVYTHIIISYHNNPKIINHYCKVIMFQRSRYLTDFDYL